MTLCYTEIGVIHTAPQMILTFPLDNPLLFVDTASMRSILFLLIAALSFAAEPAIQLPAVTVSAATGELRPVSLTGEPAGFLDTPRAYSSIGQRDIEDLNLRLTGLPALSSSVQVPGTYGHTATVNVRGDMAELYQNGQRRTNNAAGFQPSFNGVEQVDIIKGAAPVAFGPGFYSGGYLNLQTKVAAIGRSGVTYGATLGTLSADHSYLSLTGSLDVSIPVNRTTAVRVSYEGRDNDTFYTAGRDDAQDVFVTVRRELPSSTLDLSLQHVWQAIPQIEGINRPSQELIWDRTYQSDTGSRQLRATDNLVSPGDFSNANVTTAQAIYSQGTRLRSYTLVEAVSRRRFNAFAYAEYARQLTADQRLEWHWDTGSTYTLAGLSGRFERRESYTNYFNALFDAHDITTPTPRDASLLPGYLEGTPGPGGRLFFGPLDGNTDTTLSHLYQGAAFGQHRIRFGRWQALVGARVDAYRVFVTDPLTRSVSDDLTTHSISRTASVIRTFGRWSVYGTYARLYSVNGTVSGGGIVLAPDMRINEGNLRSLNRLYEVGLRGEWTGGALSVTTFHQERQQPDLYAYKPNDIAVRGVELELTRRRGPWSAAHSITYQEGAFRDSQPFELPSATLPSVSAPGDYRIPGLSRVYVASSYAYQGRRWSAALRPRWQSEQSGTGLGGYHIPSQATVDAQLGYHKGRASVVLNVGNVLNRWSWVHNGDSFASTQVLHHQPLANASLTLRVSH